MEGLFSLGRSPSGLETSWNDKETKKIPTRRAKNIEPENYPYHCDTNSHGQEAQEPCIYSYCTLWALCYIVYNL